MAINNLRYAFGTSAYKVLCVRVFFVFYYPSLTYHTLGVDSGGGVGWENNVLIFFFLA